MTKETKAVLFRFLLLLALGFLPAFDEALRSSGPLDWRLLAAAFVIALFGALEKTWGTWVLLPAVAARAVRKTLPAAPVTAPAQPAVFTPENSKTQ